MEGGAGANAQGVLKVGDYITIKNLFLNYYLCAEGILVEDVIAEEFSTSFEDALFCIYLQRQYSAARELDEFLASGHSDEKILHALQRGRDNENRLNESYMAQKIGTPVCFGDIVQLFHVKSGKFVTVSPDQLARDERENIRINLNAEGNPFSWVQILPRYKIDRVGDRILGDTEVLLKAAERPNEFIHCSEKLPPSGYSHEVNCSLEISGFRLSLFQNVESILDPNHLLMSELVRIFDPETKSNITVLGKAQADAQCLPSTFDGVDVVIQVEGADGETDSNALWLIESKNMVVGGPIQWKTDQIRFRSLNTGQYLCMEEESGEQGEVSLACTRDLDATSLFSVSEISSSATFLSRAKAVQISSGGRWIPGFKDRGQPANLLIHRYAEPGRASGRTDPLDVHVGLAARLYLHKVLLRTTLPAGDFSSGTIWPGYDRAELPFFEKMCEKIILFVQGYAISAESTSGVSVSAKLVATRQNMMCDQGTLDILIRLIDQLRGISDRVREREEGSLVGAAQSEEERAVLRMGGVVLDRALAVLFHALAGNHRSQLLVADAMPSLLHHVGAQPLAAKCVTEMLESNMELQVVKIGIREITIFMDKLTASRMDGMYLHLLGACCTCQGRGVVTNQIKVSDIVFKNREKILISVRAEDAAGQTAAVEWGADSLYLPEPSSSTHLSVRGAALLGGLPRLTLAWQSVHEDLNPQQLFGSASVALDNLFQNKNFVGDDRNFQIKLKQQAIVNYIASQLVVLADICLGRNYVAMKKLEDLLPYEVLVTIMKMEVTPLLQSAAVTLVLRLHVDRDPQVASSVPCLSRTWSEVVKSESPTLPRVEASREHSFALLQQMISTHVREMQGKNWEAVSLSYVQLLHKLVVFNFYGSEEKLADVIGPLVSALDRRKVVVRVAASTGGALSRNNSKRFRNGKLKRGLSRRLVSQSSSIAPIEGAEEDPTEKTVEEEIVTWQHSTLEFLESLKVLCAIVLLVLVALSVTLYQAVSGAGGAALDIFDYCVTAAFLSEICLRLYCFFCVRKSFFNFFKSVLNCTDVLVVLLDLILLGLPNSGSGAQYFRAARLIRLVRIFRAARLVQKLTDFSAKTFDAWKMPLRYSKTPAFELETMVEAVKVLSYAQRIIEDRNLSLLLRAFYKWESGQSVLTPFEIFEDVMANSKQITLGIRMFDDIFLDNLMYVHPELVQVGLDVLMAHNSSRSVLLSNARQVQLLVSPASEELCRRVDQMLIMLERHTETNDIWCELSTPEHVATSNEIKRILNQLIVCCRTRRTVLQFEHDFKPVPEVQDLLRNLGFFEIAMKVLRLLHSVNANANEVASGNNLEIIKSCNELMFWFLFNNKLNQKLVFSELSYFLDTLDVGVRSHKVLQALFDNNEDLMRSCPLALIGQMADHVCNNGHRPQYLSLLGSITNVGEKNVLVNQYEIVKQLIAPARIHKMTSFVCSTSHPDYAQKVELMRPFLNAKNVSVDDVPEALAYHLEFLRVLSGCTVGRANITTVEAKVQSVMDYRDILDAILDPRSMLLVKTRLALFFFNAMIEVEINISGLSQSARVWKFLETTISVFADGCDDLKAIEKNGWENSGIDRLRVEYVVVCAMIVAGFFQSLYDPSKIRADDSLINNDKVQLNIQQVNQLISEIFVKVKAIVDLHSPLLSKEHHQFLLASLRGLNKAAGNSLWIDIKASAPESHEEDEMLDEQDSANRISKNFAKFLKALEEDERVQEVTHSEGQHFIGMIESLPRIAESNVSSDIRYESVIVKLVQHVRDRLQTSEEERHLDTRCVQTTAWLIRAFRTMIENKWGMSIYERDDEGGEEQDEACADVVSALNQCGATALCLDLISNGIDAGLQLECVKLCVAMLFKEGGSLAVQTTMYNHLQETNSVLFFKQMRVSIKKLQAWHEWNGSVVIGEDEEPNLPEEIIIVRFLQLMSEGHYQNNQDIMREQPSNDMSINLLDDFVEYFNSLSHIPCRTSTDAAIRIASTILEVIQGPCELNQEHFVLNTELIETLNRLMRAKPCLDCVDEQENELKKTGIDIFQGILEGQGGKDVIYERVLSVIHIDIIQMLCGETTPVDVESNGPATQDENLIALRTESLVLLQMLCDYKPSLRASLQSVQDADIAGVEVACVEILWRGELQRRFFHVPYICKDLAKASKDALVENVDRTNLENKLQDFVVRARELYREINHQQVLKQLRVSGIFSRANQNTATWISFFLALIINVLLLSFYSASDGDPGLPHTVATLVNALNIFQLVFASFTLILFLVVRSPVRYQSNLAAGHSKVVSLLYTMTDGLTLYYFIYLTVCLLTFLSDIFVTFLLLDIVVKNSITRDVLNAVIYPRKQLGMTVILGLFVGYIFAFIIFFNFRNEMIAGCEDDCVDLFSCLKATIGYGLRYAGGIGDQMQHTLGRRLVVDTLYYLVVLIVLLNIIFGIIIDTFSELRSLKMERQRDTTEKCFTCGIDKAIFDRSCDTLDGFKRHIKQDHNMWNYLYFIIYLWEQDKDDDDGLEQFVRRCVEAKDIAWFPMNKAMCLDHANSAEDDLRLGVQRDLKALEDGMMEKLKQFQADTEETLDKIVYALNSAANNEEIRPDVTPPGDKDDVDNDGDTSSIGSTEF